MPANAKELSIKFLDDVKDAISQHGIKECNIINMDQVPRYFERKASHTLTARGATNVELRNANTSHKRLTYTPTVNAAGELINQNVLFSGLKNTPRDVNELGNSFIDNSHLSGKPNRNVGK